MRVLNNIGGSKTLDLPTNDFLMMLFVPGFIASLAGHLFRLVAILFNHGTIVKNKRLIVLSATKTVENLFIKRLIFVEKFEVLTVKFKSKSSWIVIFSEICAAHDPKLWAYLNIYRRNMLSCALCSILIQKVISSTKIEVFTKLRKFWDYEKTKANLMKGTSDLWSMGQKPEQTWGLVFCSRHFIL